MLVQRMVNKNDGHKLILSCTGGQRNSMEEDAWTCACREAREETGGLAWFATTPPAHVAWPGQSKKSTAHKNRHVHQECPRRAVFMYETSDGMLAERIQDLCRPPEGEKGLLPPFGAPLTAVWVPLDLFRDKGFRRLYLSKWADDDMRTKHRYARQTTPRHPANVKQRWDKCQNGTCYKFYTFLKTVSFPQKVSRQVR